ncbi:hypothetical protein HOL83_01260 [Candidatus Woesearchaeota archaeon]|jgi:hypothetical protein|nr:hypothetical protein [Candidatus Woesearchaeota archaeon]MBT5271942.1 hypothetical protein [Candidatus Woesearchaeota archaeon]MBT6041054.1 hypothetical protein [Candidatus Woesearchaeota archaeon]MBT6336230.1 hypothetical protein [Candidatus Woesearchaeota archaeon]
MIKKGFFSNFIFIFLIILMMFLVSCSQSADPTLDVAHGTQGIELTLHDVKNTASFIKGEKLNFMLEVKNLGTNDVPGGFIVVWGYDPNAIFFKDSSGSSTILDLPLLEGVKPYMPEGDSQFIEIQEEKTLNVPYGSSYNTNLLFSTCYDYQTTAVVPVCVITDMDEYISGSSTCELISQTLSSQGAPVAVTYVEPRMSEEEIQFLIEVKNVGDGDVILEGAATDKSICPVGIDMTNSNELEVSAHISGLGYGVCKNDGNIKLSNGKGVALCSFKKGTKKSSYTTELEIILLYGYSSSLDVPIEIIDPFYSGEDTYLE